MRNPGLQNGMRMREVAEQLSICNGYIRTAFYEIRRLEEKAEKLKTEIREHELRRAALLDMQEKLMKPEINSFGLPVGMSPQEFKDITGHEITS